MTMVASVSECSLLSQDDDYTLDDYQGGVSRWCTGCGDNGILAAVQRLCRDEQLAPEKTAFISGIGCSSRLPHYMKTYGFHSLHGRALPIAEGVKFRRPDLNVFVVTGDGDCCSIGTAHWIHAIRYNMNMTVLLHDNNVYGLTKNQASPTSSLGQRSNTTPRGSVLEPLNPLATTLGVSNVSFVAQAVDWLPEVVYDILRQAFAHKGLSFIRVLQRCPAYLPNHFDEAVRDPNRVLLLEHENGIQASPSLTRVYKTRENHDPSNIDRAREIASTLDPIPTGILYRNPSVPCYEDIRRSDKIFTPQTIQKALESEFDKFTIRSVK